jgi:hypothetical protein
MFVHRDSSLSLRFAAIAFATAMVLVVWTLLMSLSTSRSLNSPTFPESVGTVQTISDEAGFAVIPPRGSGRDTLDRLMWEEPRAHVDMLSHALRHGWTVEAEGRFGTFDRWNASWNLFYWELQTADGNVTLYTAVSKLDPSLRYTAAWDDRKQQPTGWELALD